MVGRQGAECSLQVQQRPCSHLPVHSMNLRSLHLQSRHLPDHLFIVREREPHVVAGRDNGGPGPQAAQQVPVSCYDQQRGVRSSVSLFSRWLCQLLQPNQGARASQCATAANAADETGRPAQRTTPRGRPGRRTRGPPGGLCCGRCRAPAGRSRPGRRGPPGSRLGRVWGGGRDEVGGGEGRLKNGGAGGRRWWDE
jgi:hypothetical protein